MWERLQHQLSDLLVYAGVAAVFGLIKVLVSPTQPSMRHNLISMFISVVVGTLAGAAALELGTGDFISLTVTSVFSLLSRDVILAILEKEAFKRLFNRAAENLVDKVTK